MFTHIQSPRTRLIAISMVALSLTISQSAYCQENSFGVQVGVGYGQLSWGKLPPIFRSPFVFVPHDDFSISPSVDITYRWNPAPLFSVTPFVGYSQFGGKAANDLLRFQALEVGALTTYSMANFAFGVGLKANYHLTVTGGIVESSLHPDSWTYQDVTDWFQKWSGDVGACASYAFGNFNIKFESWFGLTELQTTLFAPATIRATQQRILVGYAF
jgi:hypothetical protein